MKLCVRGFAKIIIFLKVPVDEAIQYAQKIGAHHYETSAKEDMVKEFFLHFMFSLHYLNSIR